MRTKKLESSIEIIDLNKKRKMIRDVCVKRGVEFSTLFLANSCKYNLDMTIIILRMLCMILLGQGNLMEMDKTNADILIV